MFDYRIYDNYEEEWKSVGFADFEEAEDYVTYDLMDADFERYSIYKKVCGN